MRTSIFGYADIGSQTGQALTHLGEELNKKNVLECVYPRGIESHIDYCVSSPIIGGRKLPRFFSGVGRIKTDFPDRDISEQLFDYFAAKDVKRDTADIHLYYLPGHIRAVNESYHSEIPIVVRGPTELMGFSDYKIIEEAQEAGIDKRIDERHRRRGHRREQTLKIADHIIALSEFVKESYVKAGIDANKITVIPLGINVDDYPKYRENNGPFSAIYVGSVNLAKGIRHLLSAWKSLGWNDASLTLCGKVSENIAPIIDNSPETVRTPGHVEPRNYLPNADVFVFPSLTEGFAKAPLEAMASGLPVIVTTNSGVNDIITDGEEGFIVPPKDPDAIEEKLSHIRNNPKERKRMGESALQTAKKYSWGRHANNVVDVLKKVK